MAINLKNAEDGDFTDLSLEELRDLIGKLQAVFQKKVQERRDELEAELRELDTVSRLSGKNNGLSNGMTLSGGPSRPKAQPKYRSKKDPQVTWTGRGADPKWLREEMAETKQPKDSFLIS
jgi:DNA-binding protein H-NS